MYRTKKSFVTILLVALFIPLILTGCHGDNPGGGTNEVPPGEIPPPVPDTPEDETGTPSFISRVLSSALSDTDNVYSTGRMIRIDVEDTSETQIAAGTIQIISASQGYDSGVQNLLFGSIFYLWDTTGLSPGDYVVIVSLTNTAGLTSTKSSLTITLAPNPPAPNKLVSDLDIRVPATGISVSVTRSYLLDSTFDGPMGYGWTHSYRMKAVETKTNTTNTSLQLVPVDGMVQIFNADGTGSHFTPIGAGNYKSSKGDFRTLTKNSDGTYALRGKTGTVFDFDILGRLVTIQDRNGNALTLNFNASGRLGTIQDASGQITTFSYDANHRITSILDPAGRSVSYSYDGTGNLISVTDTGGFTTTYVYDVNHNLTTITDPTGRKTFFTVNAEDRLAEVSGESGNNKIVFKYGVPAADQMTVSDALGNQTFTTFDVNGLVTRVVDASGNITQMTYDEDLNLTRMTDGNGNLSTFTYDALGNVLSTVDAQGNTVFLTYEPVFNQVASLSDAKGNVTAFQYDASGNLTLMTYPDGSVESFAYEAVGNLTSKTDRMNQTIVYQYDGSGRMIQKTFSDNSSDTFTYDATGNLTGATDENGTIGFAYDTANRLSSVTYPGSEVVSYAYDAAGNRTQLTYPDSMVLDYTYDALGRLTEIGNSGEMVASYVYDALSRVVRRDLQNETFSTYSYDASSRLLDLVNSKSTSEVISSFNYTYDKAGNRKTMTTPDGKTQYGYDAISQLVSVVKPDSSTTAYNLDSSGNRTSVIDSTGTTNYTTNNLNQYSDVGGNTYAYDANGNMTSKSTLSGTTTYTYDFENRLVQVVTPTETLTYVYDPFGRRTSKVTSTGTTRYIHDGLQVMMEKDSSNAIQATYIHGNWIDELLVMNRGGVDYFYSHDGLGSITELTNAVEGLVESYSYDIYGESSNLSSVGNPYLFTGREYDSKVNLYHYRERYYDPKIGRFLSTDPINFFGGLNLYSYVKNNPINWIDPLGLASWIPYGPQLKYITTQAPTIIRYAPTAVEKAGIWLPIIWSTGTTVWGSAALGAAAPYIIIGAAVTGVVVGTVWYLKGKDFDDAWEKTRYGDASEDIESLGNGANSTPGDGGKACVTVDDCDGDGLPDDQDPNPTNADSDGDGLSDWEELNGCLDSDADRVCDPGTEFPPTDPNDSDTDDNGVPDAAELSCGVPEVEACGVGDSWGDPHLITFDRLAYDFQGHGEFILVQAGADLEIQARMASWRGSRVVSVNTAVAMNVAGDTVGIYLNRNPSIYINGSPSTLGNGLTALPKGGEIRLSPGLVVVVWPDGSQLRAQPRGSYLTLKVILPDTRQGQVKGLLGNFDGDRSNDLATRDGVILASRPSFNELYKVYGESWRVSQAESLFDYIGGNTTATHTDRTFPGGFVTTNDLSVSVRLQAEQICRAAGITDPVLLEACMLDVGFSSDSSFAEFPASVMPPEDSINILPGQKVPAQMNIFGAGKTSPPIGGGSPGLLPLEVTLSDIPNQILTFLEISGNVGCCGAISTLNAPDGGGSLAPTDVSSLGGISGIKHNKTLFLVGVFLDDTAPSDPAPPRLDFTGKDDFNELAPLLNQTFFIGDGLTGTGSGDAQRFMVPAGATRLFLGFVDAAFFKGVPGAYGDNVGEINVRLQITPQQKLLEEDFEDGLLDSKISIETLRIPLFPGSSQGAGIKDTSSLGSSKAYGFGRSSCGASCFNNYTSTLKITFDEPTFISKIDFRYMELFDNWGSNGTIYIDGVSLTGGRNFQGVPSNSRRADTTFTEGSFTVNKTATVIELRVVDITNRSEIYINDLVIYGVGKINVRPSDPEVFSDDFTAGIAGEWSDSALATAGSPANVLGQYHGNYTLGGSTTLLLTDLPPHTQLVLEFDLYLFSTWDGDNTSFGPDFFSLSGDIAFRETFTNHQASQSYPGSPGETYGSAGPSQTHVYRRLGPTTSGSEFLIDHSESTFSVTFGGPTSQTDEHWGIDNVRVRID